MNYQGVLKDATGVLVPDGNYSVTFRIWDAQTNGTALWEEGRLITVQGGLLTVLLGSIVAIPDSIFRSPDRWLGVQVGLDPEMVPRARLVAVPYAWRALDADTAKVAEHSLDKTMDASELLVGDLDTARYSAYKDLLSENRIGDQVGQVARGMHSHSLDSLVGQNFRPFVPLNPMNDADNTTQETNSSTFVTVRSLEIDSGTVREVVVRFNLRPRSGFVSGSTCSARILFDGAPYATCVSPQIHSDLGGYTGVFARHIGDVTIQYGGLLQLQIKIDGVTEHAFNDYWEVWGR